MNTSTRKIVSFQEAFEVSRQLRWRMEYLEECGAKGVIFALEIEEELAAAKALLARKFNAKPFHYQWLYENAWLHTFPDIHS